MLENCFYCGTYSPEGYCRVGGGDKAVPNLKCVSEKQQKQIDRCCRFLSACKSINDDIVRLESKYIDHAKLNCYAASLWKKRGGEMTGRVGTQEKRLVSRIASDGERLNTRAFEELCSRVVVLEDRSGACSRLIVDRIRGYALGAGYDVICCQSPLEPFGKPEHLIVPELELGVFTSRPRCRAQFENGRRVFAGRFLKTQVRQIKQRRDFSFKACKSMMNEAVASLKIIEEKSADMSPENEKSVRGC